MYESFYGLREKPFSLLPDPEFLYLGTRYRTALSLLEYGILNQAGFIIITGETGTGKTTLLRKILVETQADSTVGILSHTHGGFGNLMPWILMAFGLNGKGKDPIELFQAFSDLLAAESAQGRRVILIVDEAQNLTAPMLEELRLLSNLNADKSQVLQVILSGQPTLRTLLQRPELAQFAQRVAVDYILEPMDERETEQYIRHRLMVAGGQASLFSDRACQVAYRLTGGLPRLINQICDMALAYGYAEQATLINGKLVAEAARDRSAGCILPLVHNVDMAALVAQEEQADRISRSNGGASEPIVDYAMRTAPQVSAAEAMGERDAARTKDQPVSVAAPASAPPVESNAVSQGQEVWLRRGMALRAKGRYKDALRSLEQAAQDPAFSFKAYAEAGLCYREIGSAEEALESLRKALADKSAPKEERIAVCYELGRTYQAARRPAQALESYRKVYRVNPSFKDVARRIERLSSEVPAPTSGQTVAGANNTDGSWMGQVWSRLRRLLGVRR